MMNISECSKQLKLLTKAHVNYSISIEEYLSDRKALLDELDFNINGISSEQVAPPQELEPTAVPTIANDEQQDKTQPYFAGKIDRCMSFIKGSNN